MKTLEEMAEEYADLCVSDAYYAPLKAGFLAGYQAAKDQLADAGKVMDTCEHILDMEKMVDVNCSNNLDGWISVKDRLPAPKKRVLWWNKAAQQAGVSRYEYMPHCNDTMIYWGDAGNVSIKNFTHWMELPTPPKEAK